MTRPEINPGVFCGLSCGPSFRPALLHSHHPDDGGETDPRAHAATSPCTGPAFGGSWGPGYDGHTSLLSRSSLSGRIAARQPEKCYSPALWCDDCPTPGRDRAQNGACTWGPLSRLKSPRVIEAAQTHLHILIMPVKIPALGCPFVSL